MTFTFVDNVLSFSRAHAQAVRAGAGPDEALGRALAADYSTRAPVIDADNLLAGMPGSESLVRLSHGGLTCADKLRGHHTYLHHTYLHVACGGQENRARNKYGVPGTEAPGTEAEAAAAIDEWRPRTTATAFQKAREAEFSPEELVALSEPSFGWGGGWGGHAVLGCERVLRDGLAGVKRRIETCMQAATERKADAAALDWYRAEICVCGGISAFIANHAECARRMAAQTDDAAQKSALRELAEVCEHVSQLGARNLRDAAQLFWFIHVLDDTDSPGRIDQFLLPYHMATGDTPAARRAAAIPVLDALWRKFIACRTWNVCLAGQDAAGQDACNELTWLFLGLQETYGREAPSLSVRLFKGSPPELMRRCVEVISKGSGQPALYNDEIIVPALCGLGIPVEHARNYAMNGCSQIDIQGMSHMGLEDGELNLAKCLELALHGGTSPITGNQAGGRTRPASEIQDFSALMAELKKQIEYAARLLTRHANLFQKTIAQTAPHLLRSLFIESCIERGRDMKRGGPLYNHGQFLTQGIANCGDALYTIKRLVFDEKRMTLPELVATLDDDWKDRENLRLEISRRFPKFGNGVDEVDRLAAEPLEHYFRFLNTLRTWRGGVYSGGVIVFNRAIAYGQNLAAGADGRARGEPVADSLGPAQGRDLHGPTAMLRSVAALPLNLAASATCLNMKLTPGIFRGRDGHEKVAQLFATYFRLGGQQLQVNVVDRDTLLAAQTEPDKYGSLVVRVGGYCDRFVNLSRQQQDDIVARTTHDA